MCVRNRRVSAVWLGRIILVVPVLLLMIVYPTATLAHPLGNFTVNHYSRLVVSPNQVQIFYVLDMAEIPAFQVIQQFNQDADGVADAGASAAYAQTTAEAVRQQLHFTVDGTPIELTLVDAPELTFPPGQAGLTLLRLTFRLVGVLPEGRTAVRTADFQDLNDRERLGWREIVVQGQNGVQIRDATVAAQDQSDELRTYPQDLLTSPLNQTSAQFSIDVGANPQSGSSPIAPRQLGAASNDGAFAALIALPQLDLPVVLIALATALGLGALHALEPGHGKTAAAAYLVGARATARHAFGLGLTITAMHTSSVFLMGAVTLLASRYILPERLLPWLGLASGLIVIGLGLQMILSRLNPAAVHYHSSHEHAHAGDGVHHHNDSHGHTHHLPPTLSHGGVSWRGVLAVGVSGGLLPCPAALVVLLSALGLGRVGFGLLLIVSFSAGLAVVLSGIGLTVLYGRRWVQRHTQQHPWLESPTITRLTRFVPALTGLMVVGAGVLLLYHALPLLRIWQLSAS